MSLSWLLDRFQDEHESLQDRPRDWNQFVQNRAQHLAESDEDATEVFADLILLSWAALNAHGEDPFHAVRHRSFEITSPSVSKPSQDEGYESSRSQCHASVSNQR